MFQIHPAVYSFFVLFWSIHLPLSSQRPVLRPCNTDFLKVFLLALFYTVLLECLQKKTNILKIIPSYDSFPFFLSLSRTNCAFYTWLPPRLEEKVTPYRDTSRAEICSYTSTVRQDEFLFKFLFPRTVDRN